MVIVDHMSGRPKKRTRPKKKKKQRFDIKTVPQNSEDIVTPPFTIQNVVATFSLGVGK